MTETDKNFFKRVLDMCGNSITVALIAVGHETGFYRELATHGPLTLAELAKATSAVEIYVREWLTNQVTAGFVSAEPPLSIETDISAGRHPLELPDTHKFFLSDVQKRVLFDEASEFFAADISYMCSGMSHACLSLMPTEIRAGRGTDFSEVHRYLSIGLEISGHRMCSKLSQSMVKALGTKYSQHLEVGINGRPTIILDLGCGSAPVLRAIAKEYPKTLCVGIDSNPEAIKTGRELTKKEGLESRCLFHQASSVDLPGPSQVPELVQAWAALQGPQVPGLVPDHYDTVFMLNAFHDMRDPLVVLRNVRAKLAQGGVLLIMEPTRLANSSDFNNIHMLAGASFSVCLPNGNGGSEPPMGALASDRLYFELAKEAGYSDARIAFERIYVLTN